MEVDPKDEESQWPVLVSQRKNSNASFCDICFESYHIMGRWPMLACPNDHFFCDICIEGMFRINENEPVPCPICRDLIRHSKVRPHYDLFRTINKETHVREALKDEQNQLFSYAFRHEIFEVAAAFKSGKVDSISKLSKLDCSNRKVRRI